jgi:hypothetical protein
MKIDSKYRNTTSLRYPLYYSETYHPVSFSFQRTFTSLFSKASHIIQHSSLGIDKANIVEPDDRDAVLVALHTELQEGLFRSIRRKMESGIDQVIPRTLVRREECC